MKLHLFLLSHLRTSLGDPSGLVPDINSASKGLRRFETQQASIGWSNLFCGFVSSTLADYMDGHLPENAKYDRQEWVIWFLQLIQSWVAEWWHDRCQFEHRKDKQHVAATRQNLLHRIEQVYKVQDKVPHPFRHCFTVSLNYFQYKSDNFLQNWLTLYQHLILEAASGPKRQKNITGFFQFL